MGFEITQDRKWIDQYGMTEHLNKKKLRCEGNLFVVLEEV